MQVLKTKISRPSINTDLFIERPKLLENTLRDTDRALLFIHAAAGYGKTTLMYQVSDSLVKSGQNVAWLNLDTDDNDPVRLYQYLCLSLFGEDNLNTIPSAYIHKEYIIEFVNRVAQLEHEVYLFIDEFEQIKNTDSLNILRFLYQYLPENAHLIIGSRVRPDWSLSKAYALGRIKFLNASHLSVQKSDSAMILEYLQKQNNHHKELSLELVNQLVEKTEGWLTGIQLTNLYLKDYHDVKSIINQMSGAHHQISDYLSEQVFLKLSEEMQDFALQISTLRKINLSNIAAITGHQASSQFLQAMLSKGLFLQALDEQHSWYRIHSLFRTFLENRLKANDYEHFKLTHQRAAIWYQQQHYLMEAIYHADCAEDQDLKLQLLNIVSRELLLEGRFYTLIEHVKLVSAHVLQQNGRLLYDMIWSLIITHQHSLSKYYLELWSKLDDPLRNSGDEQFALGPMSALIEDDVQLAFHLAQVNLEKISQKSYFVRAPLIGIGAIHYLTLGRLTDARKLILQARVAYIQGENAFGVIVAECIEALCDYLDGRATQALEQLNRIGQSDDYLKLSSIELIKPIAEMLSSSLKAHIYYELNQIEMVDISLTTFNEGEHMVLPDLVIIGYQTRLSLANLLGDTQAERLCVTKAQINAEQWAMPRLKGVISRLSEQLKWFHEELKRNVLLEQRFENIVNFEAQPILRLSNLITGDDLIDHRKLIFMGNEKVAIQYLHLELDRQINYSPRLARIYLLLALAYYRLKESSQAFGYIDEALKCIQASACIRIILDEHPLIYELLSDYTNSNSKTQINHDHGLMSFAISLINLNRSDAHPVESNLRNAEIEALSKRELQILKKVSMGCTDNELAEQVFLSVNTVKWHLRNIYNKLSVRSRLEAVNEAKRIGLI